MTHIVTSTGFECDIDPIVMDDMEVLDLVVRIDKTDPLAYPPFLDKIMGAENKAALYNHVREADGRVPMGKISEEIAEILDQIGEKK